MILVFNYETINSMFRLAKFFSLDFYIGILRLGGGWHPLLIAVILALVGSVVPGVQVIQLAYPVVSNLSSAASKLVDSLYPQELEITVKGGLVSTNVTEPYYVSLKATQVKELLASLQIPVPAEIEKPRVSSFRLVAIDTRGKAESFEQYQAAALVTESSVVYYNDGKINIFPLREVKDITINKQLLQQKTAEILKDGGLANLLRILVIMAPIFLIIGSFLGQLWIFTALSLLTWIIIRIHRAPVTFGRRFRLLANLYFLPGLVVIGLGFIPDIKVFLPALYLVPEIIVIGLFYWCVRRFSDDSSLATAATTT